MEPPSSANTPFPPPRRVATEPIFQAPRRSLSVSSTSSRIGSIGGSVGRSRGPEDLVETLFTHPSVKIVAFTSSQRASFESTHLSHEPAPGSLPPSSQLERTIAVGPFRIYRAPGSVAFLSCGSALQPILPKSQCWCIDEGNSRFVLQIRRPQYWRIEVPREDGHRALTLREVFDKILLFEKTECPFQRSFTVELPERPQTPIKKKAWTPIGKNLVSSPFSSELSPTSPPSRVVNTKTRTKAATEGNSSTKETGLGIHRERGSSLAKSFNFEDSPSPAEPAERLVEHEENVVKTLPQRDEIESAVGTKVESYEEEGVPPEPQKVETDVDASALATQSTEASPEERTTPALATPTKTLEERAAPRAPTPVQFELCTAETPIQPPRLPETPVSENKMIVGGLGEPLQGTVCLVRSRSPESPSPNVAKAPTARKEIPTCLLEIENPVSSMATEQITGSEKPEELSAPASRGANEEVFGYAGDDGPQSFEGAGSVGAINLKKKRMSRMLAGRSAALPPQLTVVTSPPSRSTQRLSIESLPTAAAAPPPPPPVELPPSQAPEETSPVGSADSFHSVQSWHSPITPLPPSPPSSSPSPASFPFPHGDITIPKQHLRDSSDLTITPNTDATFMPTSAGATICSFDTESSRSCSPSDDSKPTSPALVNPDRSASHSSALVERPRMRHRPRPNNISVSSRGFSPLPPAANLFSPPSRRRPSNRLEAVRKLPSTIIHKTVEILLSPPSHLVNLMLKVAAKIAAGEWRGLVFGFGESGEQIPVQWDYSDGEYSSWDDDEDYTFTMGRLSRRHARADSVSKSEAGASGRSSPKSSSHEDDGSWEVD